MLLRGLELSALALFLRYESALEWLATLRCAETNILKSRRERGTETLATIEVRHFFFPTLPLTLGA